MQLKGVGPKRAQAVSDFLESRVINATWNAYSKAIGTDKDTDKALEQVMQELATKVKLARRTYYGGSELRRGSEFCRVMSDAEYDVLVAQLRKAADAARNRDLESVREIDTLLRAVGSPLPTATAATEKGSHRLVRQNKVIGETSVAPEQTEHVIKPVQHSAARGGELLSLASVHSAEELRTWWDRAVVAKLGDVAIVVEPKVDGLTLRVSYEAGQLVEVNSAHHVDAANNLFT
jgi:NAD-dependent DNA ligase